MSETPRAAWDNDPLVGLTVASGRFQIVRVLGEGGIGRVYEAIQCDLGRKVALKVLHRNLTGERDMTLRFQREARAASALVHPGSVVVFDYGQFDGRFYIAMEFIDGPTLGEVLTREFPLGTDRVVRLMVELCDVLEVAHGMGLLHRDLKPDNILLTLDRERREHLKVVDFGLAILLEDKSGAPRVTKEGTVSGTPAYMSPEQALDRNVGPASDIYSLGCVFYECLTGRPPFDGDTPLEILSQHLYNDPTPPSAVAKQSDLDRGIELVCLWCLGKRPADRPRDAAELRRALHEALARIERGESANDPMAFDGLLARAERASKAGIAPSRPSQRAIPVARRRVVVFQDNPPIERSGLAVLRAHGMECWASGLTTALPAQASDEPVVDAVVVDLRGFGRAAGIAAISDWCERLGPGVPVLAIGPEDDMNAMVEALRAGAEDYAPEGDLGRLPEQVSAALRRTRRHRGTP